MKSEVHTVYFCTPIFLNCPFKAFCHLGIATFCIIPYLCMHSHKNKCHVYAAKQRKDKEKVKVLNLFLQLNICMYLCINIYISGN